MEELDVVSWLIQIDAVDGCIHKGGQGESLMLRVDVLLSMSLMTMSKDLAIDDPKGYEGCNFCGHLERCGNPSLENSKKTT